MSERVWRAAGLLVLAACALPLARHYLITYPQEILQVDLAVYREGARALVEGYPLYDVRTGAPQFLPFTYPPFAAVVALPLLAAPFPVVAWAWTVVQIALLWFVVGVAFRPFLARCGARGGLVQGGLAGACTWFLPVADGVRYGQVNAVIVALCLWDVTRPATRAQGGSGVGVALATAVKLTPGVFWLHWAASGRWQALRVSLATAFGLTVAAALLAPEASARYWAQALLDPDRLGPNAGTSNQSLRGVLLRVGPGEGWGATLLWALCTLAVLAAGLALCRRLDRLGEPVAVVAAAGLVAFLVSPVSWVHHLHWGVVVLGVVLGDGRAPVRVLAAGAGFALLWVRLPWWGANLLGGDAVPDALARVAENSYALLGVLGLALLWRLIARPQGVPERG